MDWRRAKTILIIAFLLLDSFLFYQLWTGRGQEVEMGQQNTATSSNLQDVLKARNIKLQIEAPAETPEMYYLNIRYGDIKLLDMSKLPNQMFRIEGHILQSQFLQPLPSPSSVAKGDISRIYKDHILFFDNYKLDAKMSHSNKLVYHQLWNTYPFFGATLELNQVDQNVIGYHQIHYEVVNKGSGKKVISSITALRTLIENNMIGKDESIHAIDLGYYGHTYDADIQVIAPVWRVIHGSNQVHYVNGITGVIEKTPSLPKKE